MSKFLVGIAYIVMATSHAMAEPSGVPVILASPSPFPVPAEIPVSEFLAQVMALFKSFGGMSFALKMSGIVLLLIASMKVSFLRPFWDKLGSFKALAAPVLSLIVGVLALGAAGGLSLPGLFAYLFAGSGAIILHELLDAVKAFPGIGPAYLAVINFLQGFLKQPQEKK